MDKGEKNKTKGLWAEIKTEIDHSTVAITLKPDLTCENQFNLLTKKSEYNKEK